MTAAVLEEDRARCRHAGMNGFLTKPVQTQELERVLDETSARVAEDRQRRPA